MQEVDQHSITEAVLEQMSSTPNPRLKEVMAAVVRHLHEICREVDLRPSELFMAMEFLKDVGQISTPQRQEFMVLSAVLGLDTVVNILDDARTGERGTPTSIFGPFYVADSPLMKLGDTLAAHAKKGLVGLYGTVRDSSGRPIPDASVEIWQTDEEGLYDVQHEGGPRDLRGRFLTDAQGRYYLKTTPPLGYSIPTDGPSWKLVRAQNRDGMRPAHIHFRITAPGHRDLITALYLRSDKYIESDAAFGVTESIVRDIADHDLNSPFPDLPALNFDIMLRTADVPAAAAV
jgi:catechol 1,2-dioxygenase/hydroxyquinol 1,2-dioxygenase